MAPNREEVGTKSTQEVLNQLDTSADTGLSETEVKRRQEQYGLNRLRQPETRGALEIIVEQFRSVVVLLLVVAGIVSFLFGESVEAAAIGAVIIINAAIGFTMEWQALKSMEALQQLGSMQAKVHRSGELRQVAAEQLVPGDIIVFESGDLITADARIVRASRLQADESALTGESTPVSKGTRSIEGDTPLAEQHNMVFKGTAITGGSGEGVVTATGMDSELGHISSLVEEAEGEVTPLEKRLAVLGRSLIWVTLGVAVLVVAVGVMAGKDLFLIIETAIALAVASIPEGLPVVATIALARGMKRMAERNALVDRLSAVETLGATSIICADKTGTLTENRMTVTLYELSPGQIQVTGEGLEADGEFLHNGEPLDGNAGCLLAEALRIGVLCNSSSLPSAGEIEDNGPIGDPTELALLIAGAKAGLDRPQLLEELPEVRKVPFNRDKKMMATVHQEANNYYVAVKGSPAAVLTASSHIRAEEGLEELSETDRDHWLARNRELAQQGLRVLALAIKRVDSQEIDPYQNLAFVGLVALIDPPREDVRNAICTCHKAGIRVVMITGDQPATAHNIARSVGLIDDEKAEVTHGRELGNLDTLSGRERRELQQVQIFARVTPEQKLNLVTFYQKTGAVVAMTGDGINDSPALEKADIGIAMGKRGTQVAREAADMVLRDDAFETIKLAVEQGRIIFANIRQFVLYLLSCNLSEVLVITFASMLNAPLPLLPLQILFLNMVTDVFPALALGLGEGDPTIMRKPPRDPEEPIMTRNNWYAVGGYGMVLTLTVLGAFALAFVWLGLEGNAAVTVSFVTLASAQLLHVFNLRGRDSSLLHNDITQNPYIWGALVLCFALLAAAVYVPPLASVLKTVHPGFSGLFLALGMSTIPLVVGQVAKELF